MKLEVDGLTNMHELRECVNIELASNKGRIEILKLLSANFSLQIQSNCTL